MIEILIRIFSNKVSRGPKNARSLGLHLHNSLGVSFMVAIWLQQPQASHLHPSISSKNGKGKVRKRFSFYQRGNCSPRSFPSYLTGQTGSHDQMQGGLRKPTIWQKGDCHTWLGPIMIHPYATLTRWFLQAKDKWGGSLDRQL